MNNVITEILGLSPYIQYILVLLITAITGNRAGLYYIVSATVDLALNYFLKRLVFTTGRWTRRPEGTCDAICNLVGNLGDAGMPSGHAQSSFLFATFWSLLGREWWFVLYMYAVLVAYQRVYTKCHTISQVLFGAVIGIINGTTTYRLFKK